MKGLITNRTANLPTDYQPQSDPPKRKRTISEHEELFYMLWCKRFPELPQPEREIEFKLGRKWRFDFCWPAVLLAVEIEGGVWSKGRHTRGKGFINDCQKYNAATKAGWRILRFTGEEMKKRPVQVVEEVAAIYVKLSSETGV